MLWELPNQQQNCEMAKTLLLFSSRCTKKDGTIYFLSSNSCVASQLEVFAREIFSTSFNAVPSNFYYTSHSSLLNRWWLMAVFKKRSLRKFESVTFFGQKKYLAKIMNEHDISIFYVLYLLHSSFWYIASYYITMVITCVSATNAKAMYQKSNSCVVIN